MVRRALWWRSKFIVPSVLIWLLLSEFSCPELSLFSAVKFLWAQEPENLAAQSGTTSGDNLLEVFKGTTEVTEKKSREVEPVVVSQVRTASHPHFDRIVFEFTGEKLPGYRLEYAVRPIQECGSGKVIKPIGSARLLFHLSPSKAHTDEGRITIKRQERLLNLRTLKDLQVTCDYEAEIEVILSLSSRVPYRLTEFTNPSRLVIDLKHSSR